MAGKHITPKQKEQAIMLRAAGYTHTVIADKTNISVSALKRLFKAHTIKRGELKQSVIDKAKNELLNDANTIANIKQEAASLLLDDLAQTKRLRLAMAAATEYLEANNTTEALQVMRAVSAGAVALKSTSETLRKSLGLDKDDVTSDDLPELVIRVMTEDEMATIRSEAKMRAMGFDDGLGGLVHMDNDNDDSNDNDILIEDFEPLEVSI